MKKDPHEIGERTSAYAKNNNDEQFFSELNRQLETVALPERNTVNPADIPLIYLVGVPRSGTTLMSQLLSRCLPVSYINNLIARFWARPSIGIRLSRAVLGDDCGRYISLDSKYGTTSGAEGPHEFGYFWRRWLRLDETFNHHPPEEHLVGLDRTGLRHALENEIIVSSGRSVVFKNVICGFHASFLTELHKKSLFIYVKRDSYASTASILHARFQRYGSYSTWWSLKPATWPFKPDLSDPVAEVARQVIDCDLEFSAELGRRGVNSIDVSYSDICNKTTEVLEEICRRLGLMGYDIRLSDLAIPRLGESAGPELPPDLKRRLDSVFCR